MGSTTTGGDILFGITEERDAAGKTTGLPDAVPGLSGINPDQEIRRLDSMIRDGIEPRIPGFQVRAIEGFANRPLLAIRVPRSWVSPHMVVYKGSSRFYTRTNAGKAPLDVAEIRAAFLQSEDVPERIRRFRDERLGRIVAGNTPYPLLSAGKIVAHYLPVESFSSKRMLDMRNMKANLSPLYASGWESRLNLDGYLSYVLSDRKECLGYSQLFRNGAVEAADCGLLQSEKDEPKTIPTIAYEREILGYTRQLMRMFKQLEFSPPIAILLSLLGVQDYMMTVPGRSSLNRGDWNRVDRDILLLPEVMIEDFDEQVATILRPAFDAVWQSAGFAGSENYDAEGNWIGR